MDSKYDALRHAVFESGDDSRVEVNQRALIDKILARYASAGAVYRELIQNSNDAEATTAEILITTQQTASTSIVTQVVYRNNGLPFRPQDWSRLRKIAEGNPDVSKIGAFGVGAYTMFSICEEPMVISGEQVLSFAWKGDSLWTKTAPSPHPNDKWTTFVLPSRDPYAEPDLVKFGQFLCGSLTFTKSLRTINVYINDQKRLSVSKTNVMEPAIIVPPKSTSWWRNDGANTRSPNGMFSLNHDIKETVIEISVSIDNQHSKVQARYVSAVADVRIPGNVSRRMVRVTKKNPPSTVNIEVFIDAFAKGAIRRRSRAQDILSAFTPEMGQGRVFIGFKTSQTTGLGAHLSAPLIPTVEREAIDFQDEALRVYNTELLSMAGIVMRLTLEYAMGLVGTRLAVSISNKLINERSPSTATASQNSTSNEEVSQNETSSNGRDPKDQDNHGNGGLMGFARFMVGGVKKIADVISSIDPLRDDDDILNPKDPEPLSREEKDAVMLMRSFCPQRSTPDSIVGSAIADGFVACMPNSSPPVLSTSGIVRGSEARLPSKGIEAFIRSNVVRKVVFQNAEEYHLHVAICPTLEFKDVLLELQNRPLAEHEMIRLIQWVVKYSRVEPKVEAHSLGIKDNARLALTGPGTSELPEQEVVSLSDFVHYLNNDSFVDGLPMPPSVLPTGIRTAVSPRILSDRVLQQWFSPLRFKTWFDFIVKHPSMTDAQPEDAPLRMLVLSVLRKEYYRTSRDERSEFGKLLHDRLSGIKCIPYDDPRGFSAAYAPEDLYLRSAELDIFEGLGSFQKVSPSLLDAGINDEFLITLGVRKAISIDFLFTQLDVLKWNENPKPLITYLRKATITAQDLAKLKETEYLPEVTDKTKTFAPSELYLPNAQLRVFPFVKILQWPANEELRESTLNGNFLVKLGCKVNPPLEAVLNYMAGEISDKKHRLKCLEFVSERLVHGGPYEKEYASNAIRSSGGRSRFLLLKFLPTIRKDPINERSHNELQAPDSCFTDSSSGCMGFPILDPELNRMGGYAYGRAFHCKERPSSSYLVNRLLTIASVTKSLLMSPLKANSAEFRQHVLNVFSQIYKYLSTRVNDFDQGQLDKLSKTQFLPLISGQHIEWFPPRKMYFKNEDDPGNEEITSTLFHAVDFSLFLARVGVKKEASIREVFEMILSDPKKVLEMLGSEDKYRSLLRRIAANPPFKTVSHHIRKSPFLLGYQLEEGEDVPNQSEDSSQDMKARYVLAKAEDICIIDNSFFARMFHVLSAPQESDLEDFYARIGSKYVSQQVQTSFEVSGRDSSSTKFVEDFTKRLIERRPLLVSPSITWRPLRKNAAQILDASNLEVFKVSGIRAHYVYGKMAKAHKVTCCSKPRGRNQNTLYITEELDWFDVGSAVGDLILQRCQLKDSFFVGNLLESPLSQLRSRGFPVDRILRAPEPARPIIDQKHSKSDKFIADAPRASEFARSLSHELSSERKDQSIGRSPHDLEKNTKPMNDKQGFENILRNSFPDCVPEYISSLLGEDPSLEDLKRAKQILQAGKYPRKEVPKEAAVERQRSKVANDVPNLTSKESGSGLFRRGNLFGRVFSGMRRHSRGDGIYSTNNNVKRPSASIPIDEAKPVSPQQDSAAQQSTNRLLENSLRSTRPVSRSGFDSPEQLMTTIPAELGRHGSGCEVSPAQNLVPYTAAPGMNTGIRVFSFRSASGTSDSDIFLQANNEAISSFQRVLHLLIRVFGIRVDAVAIYYNSAGRTVAFNRNGGNYFNIRYFTSLHYQKGRNPTTACYSFWFTSMAHELAHNLVTPHNKEHGYYTESYISAYLPKLHQLLLSERHR